MRVIIFEQDQQEIKKVARILRTIDRTIEILTVVNDVESLLERIASTPFPDLVLVNRELFGDTRHPVEAKLIIASNKNHFMYLAFRRNNLNYLEKNLRKARNHSEKLEHVPKMTIHPEGMQKAGIPIIQRETKKRFLVNYQQKLLSIAVEEIAYFFSDNRFIFLKTFNNRKFLTEYRMEELEDILDPQLFFRINRSYIISIHSISLIDAYQGNRYKIKLTPTTESEMIVSRERIAKFKKWLGE